MHLNAKDCEFYYCSQVGGGGNYFQGIAHQRGYGFFSDIRRFITPLALKAGRYLGKQLFQTGKNVIGDISSGASLRDSARNRLRETSKKIKDDVFQKLQQQGTGIKRKRPKKKRQTSAKRCKKTTHKDIFSA